ncbi:MAG: helix-turn-helix domain-containing protein [Desulfobulbaceae bacterium]|nr:helix-turn-helix domain-containing protein [Desulfobulbaceae bacterium]
MAQMQLPLFPEGTNLINANVGFTSKDTKVTYFYGHLPIYSHSVDDIVSFKVITSQMYISGSVKQAEICRAFGVTPISLKRNVKIFREKGLAGFLQKRRTRGAAVLTSSVLASIQEYFDSGYSIVETAKKLELKSDTIRKAIKAGKLHFPEKKTNNHRSAL